MSQVCIYRHCRRLQTQLIQSEFSVGIIPFFGPDPNLIWVFPDMSLPEGSLKVVSSPMSTHQPVRTNPTPTHAYHRVLLSQTEHHVVLLPALWKDKLAITSTDTLQHRCDRRPAEIMTGFLLLSAEMEDLSFSDKCLISVLVRRCPAPWDGTLSSRGQFCSAVCLSFSMREPWGFALRQTVNGFRLHALLLFSLSLNSLLFFVYFSH